MFGPDISATYASFFKISVANDGAPMRVRWSRTTGVHVTYDAQVHSKLLLLQVYCLLSMLAGASAVFASFVSGSRSAERSCGMQCTVIMSLVAACAAALSRITVCMQQKVSVWRTRIINQSQQAVSVPASRAEASIIAHSLKPSQQHVHASHGPQQPSLCDSLT